MRPQRLARISLAIALASGSAAAMANPSSFMSARSFAMGGTGVAVSHPVMAGSSNPAMLASDQHEWTDDFGMVFPIPSVNARYADEEEAVDQVDDIQDVIDTVDQQIATLQSNPDGASVEALGNSAADLRDRLVNFNKDTARINAGVGLGFAAPGKTFSVGVVANVNLTATVRGELDEDDEDFLNDVVIISEGGAAAAPVLEQRVREKQNAEGEIQLDSRGRALASAVAEVGISFAHALQLNNGQILQLGITPKYVELRTFQYTETVSDFEEDELDNDQYQTDKSGFNLDIGAAYAFGENNQWNTGVVVKNLIPMELDSAASR
ncbi:MAG: conjugal transfer protein TraF, partial [Pseudomonadota bacterium]|nr:conjugal transfer protein TraF [Pseudomonadota bacterium]